MMTNVADVAIVGSGILGLAFAWEAAQRGKSVVVFERDPRAQGASIRNFGMVWPIGQPPGDAYDTALRSRERWLQLGREGVCWINPCGSLHAVYETDEDEVLREFAEVAPAKGMSCEYLSPDTTVQRFPAVATRGLKGSLFSDTEVAVDPRQAIAEIPKWLAAKFGVTFHFGTTVTDVQPGLLKTSRGDQYRAEQIFIASGIDFETLFPQMYLTAGIRKCKLQMMRTPPQPKGWKLGMHLAGGLTLAHYKAFEVCNTLPALKRRFVQTMPEYVKYGIHVLASQNELGEVTLGDSHEYDSDISIFNNERIDDMVLDYMQKLLTLPEPRISERWHGFYAKHPTDSLCVLSPAAGITIVTAPGGAGMTMSFGFAQNWWNQS